MEEQDGIASLPDEVTAPFEHIGPSGRELIDAILMEIDEVGYEPDARETALLVQAGELRERQVSISNAVAEQGEITVSTTGVVKIHPGVSEIRQIAVAIARVLSSVGLPSGDSDGPQKNPAKQRAAYSRWGK